MKESKRALRRHHVDRLKKTRDNYWSWEKKSAKHMGMIASTPCICSCPLCGNARKYWRRKSHQEIRQSQRFS